MIVEFDADARRPGVEDQIDAPAKIGQDMRGRGRTDAAGTVGRRRDQRRARRRDQRTRDRMVRRAHRDGVEPGAGEVADPPPPRDRRDQGQRPGPERLRQRQRIGVENHLARRVLDAEHMGDQRVERRPALGGVDRRDGARVGGVGGQPVDRLRRHRDEAAGAQNRRGPGDRLAVRRQAFCLAGGIGHEKRGAALVRELVYI